MYRVAKEVAWDAAHRLLNYNGKCNHIHGHSYRAIFAFESEKLDDLGMVVDFTLLKKVIQGWINEKWDHSLILNKIDPLNKKLEGLRIFTFDGNPTAENMAKYLFKYFYNFSSWVEVDILPWMNRTRLVSVEVFEGPKSSAIYYEK